MPIFIGFSPRAWIMNGDAIWATPTAAVALRTLRLSTRYRERRTFTVYPPMDVSIVRLWQVIACSTRSCIEVDGDTFGHIGSTVGARRGLRQKAALAR